MNNTSLEIMLVELMEDHKIRMTCIGLSDYILQIYDDANSGESFFGNSLHDLVAWAYTALTAGTLRILCHEEKNAKANTLDAASACADRQRG